MAVGYRLVGLEVIARDSSAAASFDTVVPYAKSKLIWKRVDIFGVR